MENGTDQVQHKLRLWLHVKKFTGDCFDQDATACSYVGYGSADFRVIVCSDLWSEDFGDLSRAAREGTAGKRRGWFMRLRIELV